MTPQWRRLSAAAVLIGLVALSSGCGGDDATGLPERSTSGTPATAAAPEPESAATVDPEHAEIIAAYEGYIRTVGEMANTGDPDLAALDDYAEGVALRRVRNSIRNQVDQGRRYRGYQKVVDAEVTAIDHDATPPTANLVVCLDASDYEVVSAEDGSPIPVDRRIGEYQVEVLLYKVRQGWLVGETHGGVDNPC